MRIILFLSLSIFFNTVSAQECYPNRRKDIRLVKKIEKLINKKSYYKAVDALNKSNDFAVFYELRSEIAWKNGNFFRSEEFALKAIKVCPDYFAKAYFFLGEIAYSRKDFVNADIYLKRAIDLKISDPYYSDAILMYNNAKVIAQIINNPVDFNPEIVLDISTISDEYLPIISPDQEISFFTRRSNVKSLNSLTNNVIEKFVMSNKTNGSFEKGKALSYPFNQTSNEGGASLTINNNVLYFTKCIRDNKGYNNCDIYFVFRYENGSWSEIQEFPEYISRSDSWESQPSVSADGNTIIFSSDRVGGFGKMDLYLIKKNNDIWSKPINLGSNINSSEYEKSPYLHTDGKTLFFASTNFPAIGGFDIFYSRKDSLGIWKKPINIGYPINTIYDEISLFVSTDGNKAYFASNNLSDAGGWDVYSFNLHKEAKPARVLFLKGNLSSDDLNIDNIEIEIKNVNTQKNSNVIVSNGSYVAAITLDDNDDVVVSIKKNGYAFKSKYISSSDTAYNSPKNLDFVMESIEVGKSFQMESVYFETDSYLINSITKEILHEFSEYLQLNNNLIIEINGFTDNIGNSIDNQILSENRAKSVRDLLLLNGIDAKKLSFNGYGESYPVSNNNTKSGRKMNRRTEFKVISK